MLERAREQREGAAMIDRRGRLTRCRSGVAVGVLAATASACGPLVDPPSTDLSGTWELAYDTSAAAVCPAPAPPGLRAGCTGMGRLTLTQDGSRLNGTVPLFGGCTSCGSAGDSFGATHPVVGQLDGMSLGLTIGLCVLSANLDSGHVQDVAGEAQCQAGNTRTEGRWQMRRTE
jgi:hypothetical protein